jgi:dihydrofolate reductase
MSIKNLLKLINLYLVYLFYHRSSVDPQIENFKKLLHNKKINFIDELSLDAIKSDTHVFILFTKELDESFDKKKTDAKDIYRIIGASFYQEFINNVCKNKR